MYQFNISRTADVDFIIVKNDSFYFNFQVRYDDVPVDLSDYDSAIMQVRESENSDPILTFSSTGVTNNIDISGLASGQIVISGETDSVSYANHYFYNLQLTNTNNTLTVMHGKFIIENDYTY